MTASLKPAVRYTINISLIGDGWGHRPIAKSKSNRHGLLPVNNGISLGVRHVHKGVFVAEGILLGVDDCVSEDHNSHFGPHVHAAGHVYGKEAE